MSTFFSPLAWSGISGANLDTDFNGIFTPLAGWALSPRAGITNDNKLETSNYFPVNIFFPVIAAGVTATSLEQRILFDGIIASWSVAVRAAVDNPFAISALTISVWNSADSTSAGGFPVSPTYTLSTALAGQVPLQPSAIQSLTPPSNTLAGHNIIQGTIAITNGATEAMITLWCKAKHKPE